MKHITTKSGMYFYPLSPKIEDIQIEDIAHALSYMCRANGHLKHFYSVAQHSINCALEAKARGLSRNIQLACLLHDASEAYISDITRPVKEHLPKYLEIEEHLQNVIYQKYALENEDMRIVKSIDDCLLYYEFLYLMGERIFDYDPKLVSKPNFSFRPFDEVEQEFICLFNGTPYKDITTKDISIIERKVKNKTDAARILSEYGISNGTLTDKLSYKKVIGQINVKIHTIGILLSLKYVLDDDEVVENLSLGAGNTGKDFDLETNKRIAEYKFVNWTGRADTIRENNIFKDFFELVIADTEKEKYIYCYDVDIVKKFFECSRSLSSVLSKGSLKDKFKNIYGDRYKTVAEYYADFENEINFVDLSAILQL